MKQAKLDRLQDLLDGAVLDPTAEDLKLLRKVEKRIFKLVQTKKQAEPSTFSFADHETLQ